MSNQSRAGKFFNRTFWYRYPNYLDWKWNFSILSWDSLFYIVFILRLLHYQNDLRIKSYQIEWDVHIPDGFVELCQTNLAVRKQVPIIQWTARCKLSNTRRLKEIIEPIQFLCFKEKSTKTFWVFHCAGGSSKILPFLKSGAVREQGLWGGYGGGLRSMFVKALPPVASWRTPVRVLGLPFSEFLG